MADILVTNKATKPGVYIGRINRVNPSGLTDYRRLPCYVGKGSRLRTIFNEPIRRSYLSDVTLAFPAVAPHIVALAQAATNDQTIARLFRSDGVIIPASSWQFVDTDSNGTYDSVLILPAAYDQTLTYALDYQSTSRTIQDELPFDDIREFRFIGDAENQELYTEFVNYYLPITTTVPVPDAANANSGTTSVGFEPAEVTSITAGPYVFPGGEVLNIDINGISFVVTFLAGTFTTAETVAIINAVISAQGIAIEDVAGTITFRSNSFDPGISVIEVLAGTADAILGTTGLQFPSAPLVAATYTTAGFVRKISGTGSPVVAIHSSSGSSHDYNRRYRIDFGVPGATIPATITVILDSGASIPEVTAGATLTAASVFGPTAAGTQPQLPLHSTFTSPAIAVTFDTPAGVSAPINFTDITGDTVTILLDDTGAVTTGDEIYEVTSLGQSSIELDSSIANAQQHSSYSAVSNGLVTQVAVTPNYSTAIAGAAVGTGTVATRADAAFTGEANRRYLLVCTASGGTAPLANRTASFVWQTWGEFGDLLYNGSSRTFSISEATATNTNIDLGNGTLVDLDWGISNFSADDAFWFQGNATRLFVTAKDDRNYILDVSAVGADVSNNNLVTFSFQTGTPEGSFGLVQATGPEGTLFFQGNIRCFVRNVGSQTTASNRFVINDQWIFTTVADDVVDWSLTTRVTETIDPTDIFTDVLGVITGTVGLSYVVLQQVPSSILYVRDTVTGALITSYSLPSATQPYLSFSTIPTNPVVVSYDYIGIEPSPGQIYYTTANIVRPSSLYNTPIRVLSYEDAARLLGPSSTTNDLLIMSEIALEDNDAPGAYFVQAFDSDGDGVITSVDINTGIESTEDERSLTDVIVLSSYASLSTALANNEKMNDPFQLAERALWVGTPIGTAIGDENTPGTLISLAQRTLQVSGENPAHGKRVLVANSEATKTITLTDGTQVSVTLDGSFIAGAIAARNASFDDPGETLLRKNLFGFDSMQAFTEPESLQLIAASIIYVDNVGDDVAAVFRIEESTTVDTSSDDNNEISVAINQKEFVTRELRTLMDNALISIVPPSEQAGVAIIQSFLVASLQRLVARGIIAPYTDDAGNDRPIDPNEDVRVFRARDSRTAYNFQYFWNARYPMKRLFGLFSVDRKFFGENV